MQKDSATGFKGTAQCSNAVLGQRNSGSYVFSYGKSSFLKMQLFSLNAHLNRLSLNNVINVA